MLITPISYLDKSCPGGSLPCYSNGQCDHSTGLCTCNEGYQGSDCSGNTQNFVSKDIGTSLW